MGKTDPHGLPQNILATLCVAIIGVLQTSGRNIAVKSRQYAFINFNCIVVGCAWVTQYSGMEQGADVIESAKMISDSYRTKVSFTLDITYAHAINSEEDGPYLFLSHEPAAPLSSELLLGSDLHASKPLYFMI